MQDFGRRLRDEYFDGDPCVVAEYMRRSQQGLAGMVFDKDERERDDLGVLVEATYTVGEYDILILSARESDGLETWLTRNGYRIPDGASRVLEGYIKRDMRFFVARVNLDEQARLGYQMLRPIQVAFESSTFMLPIRLGTVNAKGPQDLIVYALTRTGRVETTNYRTVKLPSDMDVPGYVKDTFSDFYRDMFAHQVARENMRSVFMEYAWNMSWCDPCAADPLATDELRQLGVFWLDGDASGPGGRTVAPPSVYVTRLHVGYDGQHFPDDLVFQETGDTSNFQGRYVIRHPWTGSSDCEAAEAYRRGLATRQEQEARNLADLTGWSLDTIRDRRGLRAGIPTRKWYQKLWGG